MTPAAFRSILEYHYKSLDTCKQLMSEGRSQPAKVILELLENNLSNLEERIHASL